MYEIIPRKKNDFNYFYTGEPPRISEAAPRLLQFLDTWNPSFQVSKFTRYKISKKILTFLRGTPEKPKKINATKNYFPGTPSDKKISQKISKIFLIPTHKHTQGVPGRALSRRSWKKDLLYGIFLDSK